MCRIYEIYDGLQFDTHQCELSRKKDVSVMTIAENIEGADKEEEEYIKDLFFDASQKGQEYGFIQGFKYVVVLMAECFN